MELSLHAFLRHLTDTEGPLSASDGIVTTEDGHTFDARHALTDCAATPATHVATEDAALNDSPLLNFAHQVASLCIWNYDKDAGTPYEECAVPTDGFLDSHMCLMGLIEKARSTVHYAPRVLEDDASPAADQAEEGAQ